MTAWTSNFKIFIIAKFTKHLVVFLYYVYIHNFKLEIIEF